MNTTCIIAVNDVFEFTQDTSGSYAVMVWWHGGAFTSGGNIQYPGYFLAARDVVVVVPNYRLGAMGECVCDRLAL